METNDVRDLLRYRARLLGWVFLVGVIPGALLLAAGVAPSLVLTLMFFGSVLVPWTIGPAILIKKTNPKVAQQLHKPDPRPVRRLIAERLVLFSALPRQRDAEALRREIVECGELAIRSLERYRVEVEDIRRERLQFVVMRRERLEQFQPGTREQLLLRALEDLAAELGLQEAVRLSLRRSWLREPEISQIVLTQPSRLARGQVFISLRSGRPESRVGVLWLHWERHLPSIRDEGADGRTDALALLRIADDFGRHFASLSGLTELMGGSADVIPLDERLVAAFAVQEHSYSEMERLDPAELAEMRLMRRARRRLLDPADVGRLLALEDEKFERLVQAASSTKGLPGLSDAFRYMAPLVVGAFGFLLGTGIVGHGWPMAALIACALVLNHWWFKASQDE